MALEPEMSELQGVFSTIQFDKLDLDLIIFHALDIFTRIPTYKLLRWKGITLQSASCVRRFYADFINANHIDISSRFITQRRAFWNPGDSKLLKQAGLILAVTVTYTAYLYWYT